MKQRIFLLLIISMLCVLLLGGCNTDKMDNSEEMAILESSNGYLTEDGYYFTRDAENAPGTMLWYFDIVSGSTVPVCDKAECAHQAVDLSMGESPLCNAQLEGSDIVVYKKQIYYLSTENMKVVLRRRDKDGNNDEKVADFDASYMGGRMWFYCDRAFIMAATGVSQSFEPETRESDESVMRLFVADLNSGETEILAESSLAEERNTAFTVYEMKDGRASFYDLEKDKWYTYEIENNILKEQEDVRTHATRGSAGEYWDIWEKYCYNFLKDSSGKTSIMRLNWKTGEETSIYTKEKEENILGYDLIHGKDCMYITEQNWETGFKKICFYDMETGEIKQAGGEFCKDIKSSTPTMASDKGIIYQYAVNLTKEDDVYAGDFEYRYMSLEDMLAGNDRYQVVYYLNQEE